MAYVLIVVRALEIRDGLVSTIDLCQPTHPDPAPTSPKIPYLGVFPGPLARSAPFFPKVVVQLFEVFGQDHVFEKRALLRPSGLWSLKHFQ